MGMKNLISKYEAIGSPKVRATTFAEDVAARNALIGRIAGMGLGSLVGGGVGGLVDVLTPGDQSYLTAQGLVMGAGIKALYDMNRKPYDPDGRIGSYLAQDPWESKGPIPEPMWGKVPEYAPIAYS